MTKFQPLMTISKLEGDAVFAYTPESRFPRGETLIEFIQSMYVAFRDKKVSMKQATTCTCNACRNISTLDLKFFAHYGDYFIHVTGHGVGWRYHEVPLLLHPSNEQLLQEGMITSVEPGIYIPGFGGMRVEDNVAVGPKGTDVLSRNSKEMN